MYPKHETSVEMKEEGAAEDEIWQIKKQSYRLVGRKNGGEIKD